MNKCSYSNCSNTSDLICEFQDSDLELCEFHAQYHLQKENIHRIRSSACRINHDEKISLKAYLLESLRRLIEIRKKLDETAKINIQQITQLLLKSFEHIRKQENLISNALERISINDRFITTENKSEVDSFILAYLPNPVNLFKDLNSKRNEMIKEIDFVKQKRQFIEKEEKERKKINKVKQYFEREIERLQEDIDELRNKIDNHEVNFRSEITTHKNDYEKKLSFMKSSITFLQRLNSSDMIDVEFPPKFMHFFENGTKDLCAVNVFSEADQKYPLSIPDNLSIHPGLCEISSSQLFYYGGNQGTYNYTYIIDINNKIGNKKIPVSNNKPKAYIGSCSMSEGWVYIFGGYLNNSKYTIESERYNLINDYWQNISPLPEESAYNSCGLRGNEIFITGYKVGSIFKYNISVNKYKTVGTLTASICKVLFTTQERVYVFEGGKLYKSSDDAGDKYEVANENTGVSNNYMISYPIRCGKGIYFILEDRKIYRLDMLTDKVSVIRKVRF